MNKLISGNTKQKSEPDLKKAPISSDNANINLKSTIQNNGKAKSKTTKQTKIDEITKKGDETPFQRT